MNSTITEMEQTVLNAKQLNWTIKSGSMAGAVICLLTATALAALPANTTIYSILGFKRKKHDPMLEDVDMVALRGPFTAWGLLLIEQPVARQADVAFRTCKPITCSERMFAMQLEDKQDA